jgi:CPA1 family monovalent cation:H+ antiporter
MRGIVTLAAALALPDGGNTAFPYRDFILFTAFSVVLGTLVVQGMTVGPLMKFVRLRDDGSVDREVRLARAETARAALAAVDGTAAIDHAVARDMVDFLRRKYQARLLRAEQGDDALDPAEADGWRDFGSVQRQAYADERRTLSDLRARGVIGDDAFHRVEEELDWAEVNAESRRL